MHLQVSSCSESLSSKLDNDRNDTIRERCHGGLFAYQALAE
jgi:hypothetical protein